jgi:SAM-dependent MidA family methyltransferase
MSEPENKELREILVARIQSQERISFAEFMGLALYHPRHGYYNSSREIIGPEGDYFTSPGIHPIFGKLLARQLSQMWEILGRPSPFFLIEIGAGNGLLCADILSHSRDFFPEFFENLRYLLGDQSPAMREKQKALLAGFHPRVEWMDGRNLLDAEEKYAGCVLSNELIDSFPVHIVQQSEGRIQEIFVTLRDDSFAETLGDPSSPALAEYLRLYGAPLQDGQRAEINLQALTWLEKANRALERGFILTIDYGFEAEALYAPSRRDGTLLAYFRHGAFSDPYRRLGLQDLTAHVNFTALIRKGEELGLRKIGFADQYKFLLALGLLQEMEAFETKSGLYPAAEFLKNKLAMKHFLIPGSMGTLFKVLAQGKAVGNPELIGFGDPFHPFHPSPPCPGKRGGGVFRGKD